MIRKAFTLIELLVVIAIIAILAAILFPVFAQAKAAAKAAASVSNVKQSALAIVMYGSDYDDNFPLSTAWNTGNDQLSYGAGLAFATWAWTIQPYMKTHELFMDPLGPRNPTRATGQRNFDTYYTQYGYNSTYLSPDFGATGPGSQQGASQTSFGSPAETVMIASKWAQSENTSGSDWGTGFPGGFLAASHVEPPACYNIPMWCLAGWGSGGFFETELGLTQIAGSKTGGNSLRASNNVVVGSRRPSTSSATCTPSTSGRSASRSRAARA